MGRMLNEGRALYGEIMPWSQMDPNDDRIDDALDLAATYYLKASGDLKGVSIGATVATLFALPLSTALLRGGRAAEGGAAIPKSFRTKNPNLPAQAEAAAGRDLAEGSVPLRNSTPPRGEAGEITDTSRVRHALDAKTEEIPAELPKNPAASEVTAKLERPERGTLEERVASEPSEEIELDDVSDEVDLELEGYGESNPKPQRLASELEEGPDDVDLEGYKDLEPQRRTGESLDTIDDSYETAVTDELDEIDLRGLKEASEQIEVAELELLPESGLKEISGALSERPTVLTRTDARFSKAPTRSVGSVALEEEALLERPTQIDATAPSESIPPAADKWASSLAEAETAQGPESVSSLHQGALPESPTTSGPRVRSTQTPESLLESPFLDSEGAKIGAKQAIQLLDAKLREIARIRGFGAATSADRRQLLVVLEHEEKLRRADIRALRSEVPRPRHYDGMLKTKKTALENLETELKEYYDLQREFDREYPVNSLILDARDLLHPYWVEIFAKGQVTNIQQLEFVRWVSRTYPTLFRSATRSSTATRGPKTLVESSPGPQLPR